MLSDSRVVIELGILPFAVFGYARGCWMQLCFSAVRGCDSL